MSKTARKNGIAANTTSNTKAKAKPKTPQQVRIIGGQWKRTPLPVLDAEGLRPTPDRVRETVFNWITHLIDAQWQQLQCLDLFAGSGALGFEAASRGAQRVVMVENHSPATRQLEANKEKLQASQVEVLRGDALTQLQGLGVRSAGSFGLIFIDPPYHQQWLEKILPLCSAVLADGGLIYAESEHALDGPEQPEWMAPWEVVRADKAGMVFYHLLQRKKLA